MIRVTNRHKGGKGMYIGRGTALGNPFQDGTRADKIRRFRRHAIGLLKSGQPSDFLKAMQELKARYDAGEDVEITCSCAPKACHGDIIVELIEEGLVP